MRLRRKILRFFRKTKRVYPAISAGDLMNLPFVPPDEKTKTRIVEGIRPAWLQKRQATKLIQSVSGAYGILPQK